MVWISLPSFSDRALKNLITLLYEGLVMCSDVVEVRELNALINVLGLIWTVNVTNPKRKAPVAERRKQHTRALNELKLRSKTIVKKILKKAHRQKTEKNVVANVVAKINSGEMRHSESSCLTSKIRDNSLKKVDKKKVSFESP